MSSNLLSMLLSLPSTYCCHAEEYLSSYPSLLLSHSISLTMSQRPLSNHLSADSSPSIHSFSSSTYSTSLPYESSLSATSPGPSYAITILNCSSTTLMHS